jgi:cathepsin L
MMSFHMFLWLGIVILGCFTARIRHAAASANQHVVDFSSLTSSSYTFEQYLEDFAKSYHDTAVNNQDDENNNNHFIAGKDKNRRKAIFESNLAKIRRHNNNNHENYKLGVNAFTDLLDREVPMGYDKHLAAYLRQLQPRPHSGNNMLEQKMLDAAAITATVRRDRRTLTNEQGNDDWMTALGSSFTLDAVDDLPTAVDWRQAGITTAIKSQGLCGSCWAFATTAVLESHVALNSSYLYELSVQQLVSCVDNPHHCGGNGGCTGSTSELAFDYVQQHGMVDEWSFGYQSFHGANISCSVETREQKSSSLSTTKTTTRTAAGAVASIDGWVMLPRNNYEVVMNVLAKVGPLAVAVACSPWIAYHSGVFPHGNLTSQKETDLNHLVVLEGYGTDATTGLEYWLVRNSWGPTWGENGYIKLERANPKNSDGMELAQLCGMDTTTADGEACAIDENGHKIQPQPAKICGNSGILYDVSFPIGAHLV